MQVKEIELNSRSGGPILVGLILLELACVGGIIAGAALQAPVLIVASILAIVAGIVGLSGLFILNPNEAKVFQFFGDYVGTSRETGLRWTNPLYTSTAVSLRVHNFESAKLKVNDHDGNPIEIGAVVVWRVVDSAAASFHVEDYQDYTHTQAEAALRNLATRYPYDAHGGEHETSLRGSTSAVAEQLRTEIQDRLREAGIEVIEARISHLAYAPEIAMAMLRRQQAAAVIAARQKIVEGAVGMVQMALKLLSESNVVELDSERKAAMVSNLLVVLCGERDTQPVINTGTIHQ